MTNNETGYPLPASAETGKLNIMHLKRFWSKSLAIRAGKITPTAYGHEWNTDVTLLNALGLGLEQTVGYLYAHAPGFGEFEDWILIVNNGVLSEEKKTLFNASLCGELLQGSGIIKQVLTDADLSSLHENGYVIIRNAVPKEDCDRTIALMCAHLGIVRDDPATWYTQHPDRQGIMVQLFQHPQLQKNRESPVIRQAFEQLWNRKDIWVNADRVGFNPPVTAQHPFPGPDLHWDVSIELPMPFGLSGILYLSDTAHNQGAFTVVPGFQHRMADWINSLPAGTNPRTENLHALGSTPIAASAGDFIIWLDDLPHGSSPNTADVPRFVQYIKYEPIDHEVNANWK